jgi:hypothetical protein
MAEVIADEGSRADTADSQLETEVSNRLVRTGNCYTSQGSDLQRGPLLDRTDLSTTKVEDDDELSMLAIVVLDGMEDMDAADLYQVQSITTAEQSRVRCPCQPLS